MSRDSSSFTLVTGGTGLVGAHAAKRLIEEGLKVVLFDLSPRPTDFIEGLDAPVVKGDVRQLKDLFEVDSQCPISEVVHAAAVPSESACRNDPVGSFDVNVKGTLNVSEFSRMRGLRLIYVSSQAVYGDLHHETLTPIMEEESPQQISGIYASQKLMGEIIVRSYYRIYGLAAVILRPSWVYGPGQTTVQNPVSIILENAVKKKPLILKEGGDHPLNLTYVKDLAEAILLSTRKRNLRHLTFNIDGGRLVTVREVAEAVKEAVPGTEIEVGPGYWPALCEQSPVRGAGDLTLARLELGFTPRYSLSQGIGEFAQYLVARS
ncbi:MAG: NAD(P)-dependent oxidoreductase [Candidatus Bathyarchaeia archaeon]